MTSNFLQMDAEKRVELLERDVVEELQQLAAAFGFDDGTWTLEIVFRDGALVKSYFHRGPVSVDELHAFRDVLLERARQAR